VLVTEHPFGVWPSGTSSTDVAAYSRGPKEGAAPCGVWPDPDASWGVKGSKEAKGKGKKERSFSKDHKYYWFGYKLHLLVDAVYEIPISFAVTAANEADTTHFEPLLKERDRVLPKVELKLGIADAGYDSLPNCLAVRNRGGSPMVASMATMVAPFRMTMSATKFLCTREGRMLRLASPTPMAHLCVLSGCRWCIGGGMEII
jgi:hypothetical protein